MDKNIKIAVAGTGYVGLSIATLLAQHHQVTAVDVIPEKVDLINQRKSPIQDEYIEKYLAEKDLDLTATLDGAKAYADADFVVIAAPTNYDPVKNYFDTSHVEEVIDLVLKVNPAAVMVIKSTIPVGYTEMIRKKMNSATSFSHRSSCVRARRCMTTSTPAASSSDVLKATYAWMKLPILLQDFCRKEPSRKTLIPYLWVPPKLKRLNFSPTPTWHYVSVTSTNWIRMPR